MASEADDEEMPVVLATIAAPETANRANRASNPRGPVPSGSTWRALPMRGPIEMTARRGAEGRVNADQSCRSAGAQNHAQQT